MDYSDYSDVDFIGDSYFAEWVTNPNPESDRFWQNWIANHPEKTQEILIATYFIKNLTYRQNHRLSDDVVEKMLENIIHYKNDQEFKFIPEKKKTIGYYRYAAVIIFLILFSAILYVRWPSDASVADTDQVITKISPRGVKMKIMLPDSTEVTLNSESTISYPLKFNKKERQVHFSGEAFFDVYPDASRPFKIYSENIETEVLGTSFNIQDYPGAFTSKVAVASGVVKVQNHRGMQMLLSRSQMAVMDARHELINRTSFDPQEELGWKDGILLFKEVPLSIVFDDLEKWFGVDFHYDSGIRLNDIYNGRFMNESLENILEGIGFTSRFDFTIKENNVYISTRKEVPLN